MQSHSTSAPGKHCNSRRQKMTSLFFISDDEANCLTVNLSASARGSEHH